MCHTAVNQSTATTAIMSQDPVDADNLFDSPAKPLDLKTCSVFLLPAVETTNLSKGWCAATVEAHGRSTTKQR